PDEIRKVAEYGETGNVHVKPEEIKLAEQVVTSLAAPFEPEKFRDEYQQRLKELVEAKMEGEEVVEVQKPRRMASVVDLMEALQKSLAAAQKKPPAAERPARKTTSKPARKAA